MYFVVKMGREFDLGLFGFWNLCGSLDRGLAVFVSDLDCEVSGSPMFAAYLIHQYMYVHTCMR